MAVPIAALTERYRAVYGLPDITPDYGRVPVDTQCALADAYAAMSHEPTHPTVRDSYGAFGAETLMQYRVLRIAGYCIEPWQGTGEPYDGSADMLRDLARGHLYYLPTSTAGTLTAGHPMLTPVSTAFGLVPLNDVFRAVHDAMGHGVSGAAFGPTGEYHAWLAHACLYTSEAWLALCCETRAQNAWTNYGAHLRRWDGTLPRKSDPDYLPLSDRPFAPQKCGLLSREFTTPALRTSEELTA